MKIALITDTHAGARNDDPRYDAHFERFFSEVFFPRIEKEGITEIFHLGDLFDRRKYVNFQTLSNVRRYFFDRLREHNCYLTAIIGNHDTYFKTTNDINSPRLLLQEYTGKHGVLTLVENEPWVLSRDGQEFHFIPWITPENEAAIHQWITKRSKRDAICLGHFELDGYAMFQGIYNEGGMSRQLLRDYKLVFSGHFHTKSFQDNIHYLGSPYEFVWSDFDDPRGFHIYDTETGLLEFVENPNRLFHKLYYSESQPIPDVRRFAGCCVRIHVMDCTDRNRLEQFIDDMKKQDPVELSVIENLSDFEGGDIDDAHLNMDDTKTMIFDFIDQVNTDLNKNMMKGLMESLYVESQGMEQ